jgi:hypothetical protein
MIISNFQTLNDAIVAVITTVGIAVAVSIAFLAIGAFFERGKTQARKATHAIAAPAQHPTQTDNARELVLR